MYQRSPDPEVVAVHERRHASDLRTRTRLIGECVRRLNPHHVPKLSGVQPAHGRCTIMQQPHIHSIKDDAAGRKPQVL